MNTNKGFAPIIAIIIAVVIIAGGIGGYLYIKNKNNLPIVTPSNTLTTTVVTTTSTVVTTTSEIQPGVTNPVKENTSGLERITLNSSNWEAVGSIITIEKDGTYIVEFGSPGAKETREGKLTVEELNELAQTVKSSNIFSLSDKYTGPTKTTRSWEQYSLIVKIGSDNKSISFNSEDETAPQVLRDIVNKIMQFTE